MHIHVKKLHISLVILMHNAYIRIVSNDADDMKSEQHEMSDELNNTTSNTALNIDAPSNDAAKPQAAKRAPRKLPNMSAADKLAAKLASIKREQLKLRKQSADVAAALKAAKPASRSKDGGNTWQIKVCAATMPNGKLDAIVKAVKPKLVKNQHGMLPSDATIGTIRTDFYHSMRVFKSLSEAQRKALLAAI